LSSGAGGKIEVMDQEGRIVLPLPFDRNIDIRTEDLCITAQPSSEDGT
jgi:hypothetical protein